MQKYLLFIVFIIFIASSCDKVNYKKDPRISYWGVDKGVVKAQSNDTILFELSFADDDGDLGSVTNGASNSSTISFQDSRTGNAVTEFKFPDINTDTDFKSGYSGKFYVKFQTLGLILDTIGFYDTIRYTIWVNDNAGHKSNEVVSQPILLTP